ncbi:probable ATP-dependent RNA helicase DDX20 isoform X2 [Drosophila tropicalis]|uniref:probable ATP-dependent RNA helicase DDX20 isoform X2 n=1 Tax=Drosophila tropicalis TaxID=46794 RepID=UPI0035ABE1B9
MDIMEGAIAHNLDNGNFRTSDVAAGQAKSFSDINHLKPEVLNGLQRNNFVTPTKIQAAAIPIALTGMDLLVQSKSGTGKTLIYVIAAMQMLEKSVKQPQVLIIVPTRELAIQVESTFQAMAEKSVCAFIGGTDVTKDRQRIHQSRIVIGTLGRLLHLYDSKVFNMSEIKLLVLDEADQLYMTNELKKTVGRIVNNLPQKLQIIACSATYENKLDEHLAKLMLNPILISNSERATVLLGIRQFVYEFPAQVNGIDDMLRKVEAVQSIVAQLPYEQAIFFASSLMRADSFRNYLNARDVQCDLISGALDQRKRLEAFEGYRRFTIRTMVATDLMARGVDSSYANLVINLDIPRDHVTYLHRIGRAGRFGSKGIAITLISSSESKKFKEMLGQIGTGMTVLRFPHDELQNRQRSFSFWDFDSYKLPHYVSENGESDDVKKPRKPLGELSLNNESKNAPSNSISIVFQSPNENSSLEADYVKVPYPEPQTLSPISLSAAHNQKDNRTLSSMDLSLPPAAPNSINTKTYCLVVPHNNEPSSTTLQPLGVSNTVDDASSIISDSMECGGYSSDTSYISYYESKDQRLIWAHFRTKQIQKKRNKLSARKRHILYPWRKNEKPKAKKVSHNNRDVYELNLQSLELGSIIKQNNFQIERRPLLSDPSQLELLKKFENWQEINQSLNKYINKHNWSIAKSSEWLNQLNNAMQELYYNKSKSTKQGGVPQLRESSPTFIESLVKSKPYLLENRQLPQLCKLSVHVAHQLNIPANNENAETEDEEESSSLFEIQVILSSDSENGEVVDDDSDLDSANTSSGFDEQNDSPSSEDSDDDDDEDDDDTDDDDDDDDDAISYNLFQHFSLICFALRVRPI